MEQPYHVTPTSRLGNDILGTLSEAARLGKVVLLPTERSPHYLLREPEHISHVLLGAQGNYDKLTRPYLRTRTLFGDGLLTSDGERWIRRRRIVRSAFERQAVQTYLDAFLESAAELCKRLQAQLGSSIYQNVGAELSRTTSTILNRLLFGLPHPELALRWSELVGQHLDVELEGSEVATKTVTQAAEQAKEELAATLRQALGSAENSTAPGSLLEALLDAQDRQGNGLSDAEVYEEVATLLFAGAETTATMLGWTLLLLAQHPKADAQVRRELAEVLGPNISPTPEDLNRLHLTRRVLSEAMRLYPPAWSLTRRAINDDVIGNIPIPAGSTVVVSQWVTHRLPSLWDRPSDFKPARFEPEHAAGRPAFAYFPFLGGPRQCVGAAFANLEALAVLAVVLSRFRFRPFPLSLYQPEPWVTLRPLGGLWLHVEEDAGQ